MKKLLVMFMLLPALGCAQRTMTDFDVTIAASQSASRVACYNAEAVKKVDMTTWTADRILAYENAQALRDAMKIIGKVPLDPCAAETNVYDAEKTVAQENTKQAEVVGAWGKQLLSSAVLAFGIYEAADMVKSISKNGGTTVTGDGNTLEGIGNTGNSWSMTKDPSTDNSVKMGDAALAPVESVL